MATITIPVKEYTEMASPYSKDGYPTKVRFYVRLNDIPDTLIDWMSTNPREQNLNSTVAKAIAASIRQDTQDFHLKNRGILLSAATSSFTPTKAGSKNGQVELTFDKESLHGNVDGGHTLRLILAAQAEKDLPEQYVEFEVLVGLKDILPIAEARNTSVALDMRTMEEMKGSFDVLKDILGNVEIQGDRFFDRVELKMNQQLEEANHIDIRTLISIILMFNQELYPLPEDGKLGMRELPVQMNGNPEVALKKYLALGGGDAEKRNESIQKMAPIMKDIILLWDTIEREFPLVKEKQYQKLTISQRKKAPVTVFSNAPMKYTVPQSLMFPVVGAFIVLVKVNDDGSYAWTNNPLDAWTATKEHLVTSFLDSMKSTRNNLNSIAKKSIFWQYFYQFVLGYRYEIELKRKE